MIFLSLTLLVSLAILLLSADLVVRGAVALALRFSVPPLIIGLTIVAFGTSAPELAVSGEAAFNGLPGIAIGNVVGSNIANILLVLGLPAMILPIATDQPTIRRNTILMIAGTLLFIWLSADGIITFQDGAILFSGIILFLVMAGFHAANGKSSDGVLDELRDMEKSGSLPKTPLMITFLLVLGLIGLPAGSYILLESASELARIAGVPNSVIGMSLIALGTSLPELATSLTAALRNHPAIAMGNVIGSNIFNILAVMGLAGMIADLPLPGGKWDTNLWIMLAAALVIMPFAAVRGRIGRGWGALFFLAYLAVIYVNFTALS